MSDYEDLTYEIKGHVALITLNRPERLNALSEGMTRSIAQAFRDSQANDDVRVVIVTGAGRGFCSGADLRAPRGLAEGRDQPEGEVAKISQRRYNLRGIHATARAVQALDKPYIACVNGAAAGAGMDFASMADIRWAGTDAKFTTAFTRVGIVAGDGGGYYLPRVIGMAKALELLWTSRLIDAQEALSIGYVTKVIDNATLLEETLAFAADIASQPPIAVQYIKQLCYQSMHTDLDTSLRMSQYMQTIASATEDAAEGPRAFREKRKPVFKGE
jgi:2-(1,2-epoxy-1,2-dihydrophenyl)acetyl-CoA isomerase